MKNIFYCVMFSCCLFAAACQAQSAHAGNGSPEATARPNVLVIVVDTLPAHFVGAYSSDAHTPNLDALAKSGAAFQRTYSVSSWTKPTIASILTSRMPAYHQVTAMADRLPQEELTAAEFFGNKGYQTAAFVSHTILKKRSGYAQGFHTYEQLNRNKNPHMAVSSSAVTDSALQWLKQHVTSEKRPFFLFLHYFDPHFRYRDHPEFSFADGYTGSLKSGMSLERLTRLRSSYTKQDLGYLKNLFREEVAYTDMHIGRVLSYFKTSKTLNSTIVAVTADHGEEFMEHKNLGHTRTLFSEITRIPFLISYPEKVIAGSYATPVNQLDLLPTVAALAGLQTESTWQGRNLMDYIGEKNTAPPEKPFFAEVAYRKVSSDNTIFPHLSSVWLGDFKLIVDRGRKKILLYDLKQDPQEKINLASSQPTKVDQLHTLLTQYESEVQKFKSNAPPEREEFSTDEIEKLKSLGYL